MCKVTCKSGSLPRHIHVVLTTWHGHTSKSRMARFPCLFFSVQTTAKIFPHVACPDFLGLHFNTSQLQKTNRNSYEIHHFAQSHQDDPENSSMTVFKIKIKMKTKNEITWIHMCGYPKFSLRSPELAARAQQHSEAG